VFHPAMQHSIWISPTSKSKLGSLHTPIRSGKFATVTYSLHRTILSWMRTGRVCLGIISNIGERRNSFKRQLNTTWRSSCFMETPMLFATSSQVFLGVFSV
jgi:hypothetical protein